MGPLTLWASPFLVLPLQAYKLDRDGDRPARMCATAEDGGGIHAGSPQELARAATRERYGAMNSSSRASTLAGDQDVLNIKREGGECASRGHHQHG